MADAPSPAEQPGRVMRFMQSVMRATTPWHVRAYRALGGRFVNKATGGAPVLLLTTTGRRSGKARTVTLGHIVVDGDPVVAGTNGGLPHEPAWLLNLRANPAAEVQVGRARWPVRAQIMEGAARDEVWRQLVAAYSAYRDAQRWAGREIPMIRLQRAEGTTTA